LIESYSQFTSSKNLFTGALSIFETTPSENLSSKDLIEPYILEEPSKNIFIDIPSRDNILPYTLADCKNDAECNDYE
jgi:hypothetical protein